MLTIVYRLVVWILLGAIVDLLFEAVRQQRMILFVLSGGCV
jgi:hypothetical protein